MKFNPLNVPTHWQNYWTRFPEGHTILEALISWVSQVDDMVDNQNNLNTTVENYGLRLDDFLDLFDTNLRNTAEETLKDWQESGFLNFIINEAIQWQLDDYITTNEQDKLSLTTQLAQKATKGEITYRDLSIATDADKLKLVNLSDEVQQALTGNAPALSVISDEAVSREKIAPRSVSVDKTNFLSLGKNKFEGDFLNGVTVLTDGTISTSSYPNTFSAIAKIEDNQTYTVTKFFGGNRFRVAVIDQFPNENKLPATASYFFGGDNGPLIRQHTFTNDVGGKYVVVATNSQDESVPNVQVEEGNLSTSYKEPAYQLVSMNDFSIEYNHLANSVRNRLIDFEKSANLFNGKYSSEWVLDYDEETQIISYRADVSGRARVAVIPIEIGKTYTIRSHDSHNRFIVAGMDSYPSQPSVYTAVDNSIYRNNEHEGSYTFTNTNGNNFLILYVSTESEEPRLMVEEGSNASSYEDFGYKIPLIGEGSQSHYYILDDIAGIYDKPNDLASAAVGEPFELISSSHTDIYDIYDELVSMYPDYVERTLLGNDSSGLPIYQYRFYPEEAENNSSFAFKRPKIVITSAIHGHEQLSAWSTAKFFEDLCHNNGEKKQLEYMRWNIEFVVVPVCNPYGYDNNERVNYNGVDLNRNFPENWVQRDTLGDSYYSGESPASEIETQIIMDFIENHSDAIYHIDHHNIASGYPLIYAGTATEVQLGMNLFASLTRKWRGNYTHAPETTMFGYINSSAGRGTMTAYSRTKLRSTTLESAWRMPFSEGKYDKLTVECAVDLFGNALVSILKTLS